MDKLVVTRRIAAEAAIWITRLHRPECDAEMLLRCIAWQARSPAHRYAYERTKAAWDAVGQLAPRPDGPL